jgi:hypothetical protein
MATATMTTRPPLPPFTRESAIQKGRLFEQFSDRTSLGFHGASRLDLKDC